MGIILTSPQRRFARETTQNKHSRGGPGNWRKSVTQRHCKKAVSRP